MVICRSNYLVFRKKHNSLCAKRTQGLPPIRFYKDGPSLGDQLDSAAAAFCATEVRMGEEETELKGVRRKRKVATLSKIFEW